MAEFNGSRGGNKAHEVCELGSLRKAAEPEKLFIGKLLASTSALRARTKLFRELVTKASSLERAGVVVYKLFPR